METNTIKDILLFFGGFCSSFIVKIIERKIIFSHYSKAMSWIVVSILDDFECILVAGNHYKNSVRFEQQKIKQDCIVPLYRIKSNLLLLSTYFDHLTSNVELLNESFKLYGNDKCMNFGKVITNISVFNKTDEEEIDSLLMNVNDYVPAFCELWDSPFCRTRKSYIWKYWKKIAVFFSF